MLITVRITNCDGTWIGCVSGQPGLMVFGSRKPSTMRIKYECRRVCGVRPAIGQKIRVEEVL